jgi:DNA-binding IclR family transcriptional regulator
MAFGFSEPPLAAHHCCVDRTRQPIGHDEIRALLADVRSHSCAADRGINDNGVRRFAAPVIQAGKLIGAIAIAQGGGVPMGRDDARLLELVRATVLRI